MEVKINGEDPLKYGKVPMNADHRLDTDKLRFPYALQSFQSGFNLLINGSSGSGKTTLLCQLLNAKNDKKNGIRRSFKKIFDNVVIVSPSLKTLKDNIFDGLKHKYKTWDEETIEQIEELLDENDDLDDDEDPQKTLLILDDCGSMLKGGEKEKMFNHLVKNRRHRHLSIICITQKFRDATTTHRGNLTHFITFKPRNEIEAISIYDEMIGQPRKYMHDILDSIFSKRYDTLLIDFTQHHGQGFQYYSNFRPVEFIKK
jgi:hypothetical protein